MNLRIETNKKSATDILTVNPIRVYRYVKLFYGRYFMKGKRILSAVMASALLLSAAPMSVSAAQTRYTRVMEYLDRGLVAIPKSYTEDGSSGMYLSWRLAGTEDLASTTFDVYKNGALIASGINATNYVDTTNANGSDTSAVYHVVKNGESIKNTDLPANSVVVNGEVKTLTMNYGNESHSSSEPNSYGYFDIPVEVPASVTDSKAGTYTYSANDMSVADVDNDGQYEIIVKWDPSNSQDNSVSGYTGNVLFSCYELDGTMLWSQPINLGCNIRAGAHYTQFIAYDLNADGYAELVMKTAPGSTDGNGDYVSAAGNTSTITSTDNTADYRSTSGSSKGSVLGGTPEYLTVFSGQTGEALYTMDYEPGYNVTSSWGDSYGNRGNRFLAAVGYFGNTDSSGNLLPSVVMCRGYYTKAYVVAYDWDGSSLTQRFYNKSTSSGSSSLYGQGNHNLSVTDADNDGYDEIVYGSAVLDHDGTVLTRTGLGHGDALHVNDFNNDGNIEVFQVHEESTGYASYGGDLWYAKSGVHVFGIAASSDVGRGVMGNVDDSYAASNSNALALGWTTANYNSYGTAGDVISSSRPSSVNSLAYWDGDLGREVLDGANLTKFDASSSSSTKFYFGSNYYMDLTSNNSTKSNLGLTADILGDWREEMISGYGDVIRVYISSLYTDYKLTTLMHDGQYRNNVATENVAYNQPPHTSYYIGSASLASSSANYLNPRYLYTEMTTTTPDLVDAGETVTTNKYKYDFGDGTVQSGFTGVTASTSYSTDTGYGFTGSQSSMTRAPYNIPSGYEDLHADQIQGETTFKTDLANGDYIVVIHYGSWNTSFGTRYNVEGTDSGNLYSTDATTYTTRVTVSDGTLDIGIAKGAKSYGGYINGLEIYNAPEYKYYYDFGSGDVQDGYTAVPAATEYSVLTGYGFTGSQSDMARAPYNITSGYENLHADQVQGETTFKADVPNGIYNVVINYGCWNTSFGTSYNVEGTESGNLYSTDAAEYCTTVVVEDGTLDVAIAKGAKSYGGYINGMEIYPLPSLPYQFDFGDGSVQDGYNAVTASSVYSSQTGYGFTGSQSSMTRAPYNIPSGYDNLYADQIQGETTFKADIPNGVYSVVINYGSWNTSFGTSYNVEGTESGNLYSTDAAEYEAVVVVEDGVLDVAIAKGAKSYGGYISGMVVTPTTTPEPTAAPTATPTPAPTATPTPAPEVTDFYFDFGNGTAQSGYTAVVDSNAYSASAGYGFTTSVQSAMTRAPYNVDSSYTDLYADQIMSSDYSDMEFVVDLENGVYDVTVYYGCWNTGFGTEFVVEGESSGDLYSTDATSYNTEAIVRDGQLTLVIAKGAQKYGGYINGLDIVQTSDVVPEITAAPTATPTPAPTATPTPEPTEEPTAEPTEEPVVDDVVSTIPDLTETIWWIPTEDVNAGDSIMEGLAVAADTLSYISYATTIDGIEFAGGVNSSSNPKYTDGTMTGNAIIFTAPADGVITSYMEVNSGKTMVIADSDNNTIAEWTNEGDKIQASLSAEVETGKTYYLYIAGSKGRFFGVSYTINAEHIWVASEDVSAGDVLFAGLTPADSLTYADRAATIDGIDFAGAVNGTSNPKYANGTLTGNGMIFTAPANGEVTIYMEVNSGKTMVIADSENNYIAEWTNDGAKAQTSISAAVEAGKTYYLYTAGSKARIYGVSFIVE